HGRPDRHCFAEDTWISCKSILPPGIARYSYGMASRRLVVRVCQQSSSKRIQTQSVEVSAGNQLDPHGFEVRASSDAAVGRHQKALDRGDGRECLIPLPEFAKEWIRKGPRWAAWEECGRARSLGRAEE